MPDRLDTTLATLRRDVQEQTTVPDFAELVARANHRRHVRVGAAAGGAVAAAAATALAVSLSGMGGDDPRSLSPAASSTSTAPPTGATSRDSAAMPADAQAVIDSSPMLDLAVSAAGQFSVFGQCTGNDKVSCAYAWQVVDAGGKVRGGLVPVSGAQVGPEATVVTGQGAADDTAVVTVDGVTPLIVRADGTAKQATASDGSIPASAKHQAVVLATGSALVVDLDSARSYRMPKPNGLSLMAVASGTPNGVFAEAMDLGDKSRTSIVWSRDGAAWQRRALGGDNAQAGQAIYGALTGRGDRVVASWSANPAGQLDRTENQPLVVTTDGGTTWREVTLRGIPADTTIRALGLTEDGTLFVLDTANTLWRTESSDWTEAVRVAGVGEVTRLFVGPESAYAMPGLVGKPAAYGVTPEGDVTPLDSRLLPTDPAPTKVGRPVDQK
ncbi:hypothetical protein [Knoellia koreensis]|uniref:Uncharacterized protein n=1 Tax=Knoellia koreensis TaxID=2730921 RepID=A0A849HDI6_9MICO|nr:hypothetical protein [Knoellia sp. DB2414S]NNM45478.1 hypothetical protein [Knoellia sp. DB2414S]